MTTPTTCEATDEQRARAIAAVESWSDARLQGDDLHAAVAQFVAQESAREHERAEGLAKERDTTLRELAYSHHQEKAATARVAELEKQLAEKEEQLKLRDFLLEKQTTLRAADLAELARLRALPGVK